MKIETEINKVKKKLINKVKIKGIYENFGQKEIGNLKDKFDYNSLCINDLCLNDEQIKIRVLIDNFDAWCLKYNGEVDKLARGEFNSTTEKEVKE